MYVGLVSLRMMIFQYLAILLQKERGAHNEKKLTTPRQNGTLQLK